jgi:moderate conductance mechanosensitive channel
MKKMISILLFWAVIGAVTVQPIPALSEVNQGVQTADAGASSEGIEALPENYTTQQVDEIIAHLSDDQVRRLLIHELKKEAANANRLADEAKNAGLLSKIIGGAEHEERLIRQRLAAVISNLKHIPGDFSAGIGRLAGEKGSSQLIWAVILVCIVFIAGRGSELFFRRFRAKFKMDVDAISTIEGFSKLYGVLLKTIPELLEIFIFVVSTLVLSLLIKGFSGSAFDTLFWSLFVAIMIPRAIGLISQMICSPASEMFRLLPVGDETAEYIHKQLLRLFFLWAFGFVFCTFFYRLGIPLDTFIAMVIVVVTLLVLIVAVMIWKNRTRVSESILSTETEAGSEPSWHRQFFANIWHTLALAYLLIVWVIWIGQLLVVGPKFDGSFIISLMIVPIYLMVDRLGQWAVSATMHTVGGDAQKATDLDVSEKKYEKAVRKAVRIVIIFALFVWIMSLWGFHLPYGKIIARATFNILVAMILAHIGWKMISQAINKKLMATAPGSDDETVGEEEEWGSMVLDRTQTYLPPVRKFLGSVLVVIVVMIVLSSLGVDIGPLLAGAGVVGIAIGFGAQKLVSDVLSGLFYLIDDSFRIGEYLMAGSTSGTVEKITMRNLWLRHHRGMLQIVPYGDLGNITNFMRGTINVKFNLELPYGTDIETVRKVIKKVGKEMLKDEELGPDMTSPVKSQGVRSVGNSVMTFRAKFSAKPGAHFLIRREAFRRITEALAKKGIHYAHRKVIVEMPDDHENEKTKENDLKSGAGAAFDTIIEEEKEGTKGTKKSS